MSRFLALLAFLCLLAAGARAQVSIPITGATSAPHCTVAQLAARTGNCSVLTPDSDEVAVVTDASGDSCTVGGGATQVTCIYSATLATWIPITGFTNPATANLSMAGFDVLNVDLLDFNVNICNGLTNPKLYTDSNGNVQCIEEAGGAGGHTIQDEAVSLTARGSLDFAGTGVTCTDTGAKTLCTVPGMSVQITNGTNFVGSVSCPGAGGVPASGTAANCEAIVTSLNGQVFAHGYVKLAGTYDATTPHKTADGFKMTEAVFLPTCNGTAYECGDDFATFTEQLRTLAAQYDPWTTAPQRPKVGFIGYGYNVDPRRPFKLRGARWVLDMSASPDFAVVGNADNATQTITGTATITTGTDPSLLVCASCGFHGAGTGYDGDEPLEPGDAFRLVSAGSWGAAGARIHYVTKIVDDDNIRFTPPATSDYSGSIEGANGWIWEVDNLAGTGSESDKIDNWGGLETIGGLNASLQCGGSCLSVNNWTSPQRDNGNALCTATDVPFDCCTGSGTGTCVGTYRTVPLGGVRTRQNPGDVSFDIRGLGGKWDRGVAFTMGNVGNASDVHGEFTGGISMDNGDATNGKFARTGFDDTTSSDDGRNAAFLIMAPNIYINPRSSGGGGIYVYAAGPNCGNMTVDARLVENVGQLLYAPNGCQNLMIENGSREQGQFCDGGGGQPTCEALAARHPFIEIGPWEWADANEIAHYVFNLNKLFWYLHRQPFLKVTDTEPVRVDVDVALRNTSDLIDLSSNSIQVNGTITCTSDVAGACDVTGSGKFPNLMVTDKDGAVTFDGRALATGAGLLPLAKITDDATASRCLLSGGGGGDPGWGVCPGGGGTITIEESDGAPSVAADTAQFYIGDFIVADEGSGNVEISLVVPWRLATGAADIVSTDTSKNLIVGSATPSISDHRLNVDGSAVLNESGAAVSVRIETDTLANAFCTDGTNNRVGIGFGASCTPTVPLDVTGAVTASGKITANGSLDVKNGATSAGVLSLYEDTDDGSNFASFQVPALAGNTVYTLPADDGDAGEQLQTNGSGVLSWEAAGSGGGGALDDLTDVTITTPATGATLIYNGSAWIDGSLDLADPDAVGASLLGVANGGTGVGSLTDGGILIGNGTGALVALGVASNGQIPIGDGTTDPVLAAPSSGDASEITVTLGAGSIAIDVPTNPTFDGTVTAGSQLAVTGGCTVDTDIDCPASAAAGGALTLKEDSDLGSSTWKIDLGATNLSGNFSITPGTDGKLSGSSLLAAGSVGSTEVAALDAADLTTGTLARARGGTNADTSATGAGLFGSDGSNAFVDVDTEAELETALGGVDLVAIATDDISSANLRTALSDEAGTGAAVFRGSDALDATDIAANGVGASEIDEAANVSWTGIEDFSGGTFRAYTEVLAKTQSGSPHTIAANEVKSTLICNTGASGAAVYNLPAASAGMTVTICVAAAQDVDINPDDADQILVLTNAAGDAVSSDSVVGSIITLVALDGTNWFPVGYRGAWADAN